MYCDVVNVQPRFNFSDEIIKQSWILKSNITISLSLSLSLSLSVHKCVHV